MFVRLRRKTKSLVKDTQIYTAVNTVEPEDQRDWPRQQ